MALPPPPHFYHVSQISIWLSHPLRRQETADHSAECPKRACSSYCSGQLWCVVTHQNVDYWNNFQLDFPVELCIFPVHSLRIAVVLECMPLSDPLAAVESRSDRKINRENEQDNNNRTELFRIAKRVANTWKTGSFIPVPTSSPRLMYMAPHRISMQNWAFVTTSGILYVLLPVQTWIPVANLAKIRTTKFQGMIIGV